MKKPTKKKIALQKLAEKLRKRNLKYKHHERQRELFMRAIEKSYSVRNLAKDLKMSHMTFYLFLKNKSLFNSTTIAKLKEYLNEKDEKTENS